MKFNIKTIISSIALIAALSIAIWKFSPKNPPSESSNPDIQSTTKNDRASGEDPASLGGKHGANGKPENIPNKGNQSADKEVILEKIQDASVSYDAAELPIIKPYLLNPDPEIRKAAVDGMIVLGDAAASPMLREAAKQMNTAEDVKIMLEAAEYLELPSANLSEMLKKKKKKDPTLPATPPAVPAEQDPEK